MASPVGTVSRNDLAETTARLVGIASVTGSEAALADHVAGLLTRVRHVDRRGDCVVVPAPDDGRPVVTLVGHLDTVPAQGNPSARLDDGRVHGLGTSDMKGGLAVMLELAASLPPDSALALALVMYPGEEGPLAGNGLGPLLSAGAFPRTDLAIVLEPTDLALQLGCLGAINAEAVFRGEAAHSARPWLGVNAIHAAAGLLSALAARSPRKVIVARSLVYREVVSATMARAGVARNVVPAECRINLNARFAPGRTVDEVTAELTELAKAHGAEIEVVDAAPAGPVCDDNPLLDRLRQFDLPFEPKQAWTDVAQLGMAGIDAVNFGPGDTALAHTVEESVSIEALGRCYDILWHLLTSQ